MAAELLWRRVLQATIDTLEGRSRGQYDIRLTRPTGIENFFAGLPRSPPSDLGGFEVDVPLAAASSPRTVPEMALTVAYIGAGSTRKDWRVPSQRPETAYPLWRPGTGLLPGTPPGQDYVVLIRDPLDRFHARWLRGVDLPALPLGLRNRMEDGDAGVEHLTTAEWTGVRDLLGLGSAALTQSKGPSPGHQQAGDHYRKEDEDVSSKIPDPFSVDPDILDRGTAAHKRTQNAIADQLLASGIEPLSHRPQEDPPFDVGWRVGGTLHIAEVKSLTRENEEKQLRLGLGQLLRYAHQLRGEPELVRPVLAAEREPSDPAWSELCKTLGVDLVWGPVYDDLPGR
jgi:hypothetical protein